MQQSENIMDEAQNSNSDAWYEEKMMLKSAAPDWEQKRMIF